MPAKHAVPPGFTAVTPHLVCAGAAAAIDFCKRAFGAIEESRMPGPNGLVMHATLRIGGAPIMLNDEMPRCEGSLGPRALKGSPVTLHLYVDDADAVADRAVKAGAKVLMPVADMFWGDRYGQVEDPFGNRWSIATHVRDVSEREMMEAMKNMKMEHA